MLKLLNYYDKNIADVNLLKVEIYFVSIRTDDNKNILFCE